MSSRLCATVLALVCGSTVALAQPAEERASWNCSGKLVPPNGYEQETAVVAKAGEPQALQKAQALAREQMRQRFCSHVPCPSLAEKIVLWKHGETAENACAQAVVKRTEIERFKATLQVDLDERLAEAAIRLLGEEVRQKAQKRVALVIDKIADRGIAGGLRAEWLRDRMVAALSRLPGLRVVEAPQRWDGHGVPAKLDAVLRGTVFPVRGAEGDGLEVTWTVQQRSNVGIERRTAQVQLPAWIGPQVAIAEVPRCAPSSVLSVPEDASPPGSLCPGEETRLVLRSEKELHVVVLDLYGKELEKGVVIFPTEEAGLVSAGGPVTVGPFWAAPVEGESELFLVLGAPTREALGALGQWRGGCRLTEEQVKSAWALAGPGLEKGCDGFRITSTSRCEGLKGPDGAAVKAPSPAQVQEAMGALPACGAEH